MSEKLLKSTGTVSGMTFFSRVLGFIRDMVIAQLFGATAGLDAFLVAFKIPNFMRRLFAEGAFSQAFVPVLSETISLKSKDEVKTLVDRVGGSLFLVLLMITILGCLGSPYFIMIFAPGFQQNPAQFELATTLLRWTFPYLLLISLTAFLSGIQNSYHRFAIPALTPILLNLSMIGAALYLTEWASTPVLALAWGVLIGGIAQFMFQLLPVHRLELLPIPKVGFFDPEVKRILKLMVPALIGASVMQINLLIDTVFASFLPAGSLTWLYYSDRLLEFPVGMLGVALATVVLPYLSKQAALKSQQGFSACIDWALRLVLVLGVPCLIGLVLLAKPILSTLFQYGRFEANDVLLTSQSLIAFSSGLVAILAVKICVSAFFAKQDTKFPLKVALVAIVCNIVFNAILIGPLKHAGLALASTISQFCQWFLLLYVLIKHRHYVPHAGWGMYLSRLGLASLLMGMFLVWFTPATDLWLESAASWRAMQLSVLVLGAMVVYGATLWGIGLRVSHFKMTAVQEL